MRVQTNSSSQLTLKLKKTEQSLVYKHVEMLNWWDISHPLEGSVSVFNNNDVIFQNMKYENILKPTNTFKV